MERDKFPTDEERIANARRAIENGRRAKQQEFILFDLRKHYKEMSRGFRGGNYGKKR